MPSKLKPRSFNPREIALRLRQHVLRADGDLLRFDHADDFLIDPQRTIRGTGVRLLL